MIVDLIFRFCEQMVRAIDYLLPSWSPLTLVDRIDVILTTFEGLGKWIAWLNWYVPSFEAFAAIWIMLGIYVGGATFYTATFILTKLHITGGGES